MYFLTAIRRSADVGYEKKIDDTRCFGYYSNKQSALTAADENRADMHETYYNWLVIEKIPEGLHAQTEKEYWYNWDNGLQRWIHVDKPTWSNNIINWGIG